ncbi:MAG: rod shape-determining protein MreD [Clostridia bacterium]|nr:rod shape-determining protein MreD [Clostridia bacterium]
MAKYILGRQAQTRSEIIRYCVIIGTTLFLLAIIQTSVMGRIKPFGVTPDLIITAVLTVTLICGYHAGSITGIAAGFIIDALASTGISLLPLIYFIMAYLIGYYVKVLNAHGYLSYLICFAIALGVRFLTTFAYTLLTYREIDFSSFLLSLALPELLGTLLFGALIFFPLLGICVRLQGKR